MRRTFDNMQSRRRLSLTILVLAAVSMLFAPQMCRAQAPQFVQEWDPSANISGPWSERTPVAVTTDGLGNCYVGEYLFHAEPGNNYRGNRVMKFTYSGGYVSSWVAGNTELTAMATANDGTTYVVSRSCSDFCGNVGQVFKYSNTGTPLATFSFDVDGAITLDPTGNHLYALKHAEGAVGKYTSDGVPETSWGTFGTGDSQFEYPRAICTDHDGNVYVGDGTGRIQKFTANGKFAWSRGSSGSGPGQFSIIYSMIQGSDGNIWIGDGGLSRISVFSTDGDYLYNWGSPGSGPGQFTYPVGMAVNPQGNVYVADGVNIGWIQKYGPAQTVTPPPFVMKWGSYGSGPGQFDDPWGIAVDPSGNVYVTDSNNNRIQKFTNTGGYLAQWGTTGTGNGELNRPNGIATDGGGNIYVCDRANNRIQEFTNAGTYITQWGSGGTGDGQFTFISGIAIDNDNNVYVSDVDANRIQKFTNTGTYLTQWGTTGTGDSQFNSPTTLAVDLSGNVYVSDTNNHRIQKFTNTGTYLTQWGTSGTGNGQFNLPVAVITDTQGNVYVSDGSNDATNNRVQKFTSAGVYLTQWGSTGTGNGNFDGPEGLAADGTGNVYVVDFRNNRLQKFGPGPGLRPVLLLHGYCGNATEWADLGNYLSAQGFSPHAFTYTPINGSPTVLVRQLADYLDANFPGQDIDIIAHSMGGLVARQLIRQRGSDCHIKTLITLGTPNHGVDLLRHVTEDMAFQELVGDVPFLDCLLHGQGAVDLTPGSDFLNRLNYNTYDHIDKPSGSTRGAHPKEDDYQSGVKEWSIAGTSEFAPLAFAFTSWAWGVTYLNDGVVGVDAAVLWNSLDQARIDTDMGLSSFQHFDPGVLGFDPLYSGNRDYQNAQDLFPILENLLRGGVAPGSRQSQLQMMATRVTASSDSTINLLETDSGVVTTGHPTEWQFTLPQTSFAQVVAISDSASISLHKPDGTLLTPADTLTTPGLRYTGDASLGAGVFLISNPAPGRWSAVFDPGAKSVDGKYAVSVYASGTTEVSIEATPSHVYGTSTQLLASLTKAGASTTNVSWSVSLQHPDSTIDSIMLYDDGAHGDLIANDGTFGTTLNLGALLGVYQVTATATDLSDSVSYVSSTKVERGEFKDLSIDPGPWFSKDQIAAGDSMIITGTVHNLGTTAVNNVVVELWDNHLKRDAQTLSLGGGQSNQVSFLWRSAAPDTHLVELVVNPFVVPDEANVDNNSSSKQVVLGQPITAVGPGQVNRSQLLLAPPVPNPSTNITILRFSLPQQSAASLVMYDVLGRRIRQWSWAKLAPGPHQVSWDGKTDDGRLIPPGVLFYRLDVGSQHLKQKLIHLQ